MTVSTPSTLSLLLNIPKCVASESNFNVASFHNFGETSFGASVLSVFKSVVTIGDEIPERSARVRLARVKRFVRELRAVDGHRRRRQQQQQTQHHSVAAAKGGGAGGGGSGGGAHTHKRVVSTVTEKGKKFARSTRDVLRVGRPKAQSLCRLPRSAAHRRPPRHPPLGTNDATGFFLSPPPPAHELALVA